MGEVVNLRRVRKAQQRAVAESEAAANRIAQGTPKHLKKLHKRERQRADKTTDAHRLDPEKPR